MEKEEFGQLFLADKQRVLSLNVLSSQTSITARVKSDSYLSRLVKEQLQLSTAVEPTCNPINLAKRKLSFQPSLQKQFLTRKLVPP